MSVRQLLVRTNVYGEPLTPFFKDIAIDLDFASETRSETSMIGVVGGFVAGLTERGEPNGPNGHLTESFGTATRSSSRAAATLERCQKPACGLSAAKHGRSMRTVASA